MQKLRIIRKIYTTLMICFLSITSSSQAQGLVGDLIEKSKQQQRESLFSNLPINGASAPLESKKALTTVKHPKIWSITGINNNWSIEWLYNNKLYSLKAEANKILPGNWIIKSVSDTKLVVYKGNEILSLKPTKPDDTGRAYSSNWMQSIATNGQAISMSSPFSNFGSFNPDLQPSVTSMPIPIPRSNTSSLSKSTLK